MRLIFVIAAGIILSGCAGTGSAILKNVSGCERHYNGVFSAGVLTGSTFSGSAQIDCVPAKPHTPTDPVGDLIAP